jgi:hypothetical protein
MLGSTRLPGANAVRPPAAAIVRVTSAMNARRNTAAEKRSAFARHAAGVICSC